MQPLKIGIVGTGGMGKIHASCYMNNPSARVHGVCSITRELAQEFADGRWGAVAYSEGEMKTRAAYKIEKVYDDYQAMAADPDIDAVSIVTPNVLHHEIAMAMLRRKKHVLVEKPLAINAIQAREMVETARANGVLLATGHCWRYHKDVQYVKGVIDSGALGKIVQTKSYGLHLRWGPSGWFAQKALAGGGALIDMGIHAIDTTRYLIGEPAIRSVYADVGARYQAGEVDDFAQIMVKFANGVVSLFESGWHCPHLSGVEASTEIWGTKGYARVFPTALTLQVNGQWGQFKPDTSEAHTSTEPYQRQADDFIAAIRNHGNCLVGYEVGLEAMKIVDAAYASSARDEVIKF